jgi:hypothetical protein
MNTPAKTSRHQFTLGGLMWFVTVVAATCGFVRFLAGAGVLSWAVPLVLIFWPSLLALARCCRFRFVATKVRLVLLTVCLLVVSVIAGVKSEVGGVRSVLGALYADAFVSIIAWPAQVIVIYIMRLDMRRRNRDQNE